MVDSTHRESFAARELLAAVGALGIIVALVFVAMEIRQNTSAVRSASAQAVSAQSFAGTVLALEHPELRRALRAEAGGEPLSEDQNHMLVVYYRALLQIRLNQFAHAQAVNIDTATVARTGGGTKPYSTRFFREFWSYNAGQYPEDFQAFVIRELLPRAAPHDASE